MKLVSLNVEWLLHTSRVLPFLEEQKADVVCLLEATEKYAEKLRDFGYQTHFLPRCKRVQGGEEFEDGIIIASLHSARFETIYYYGHKGEEVPLDVFNPDTQRSTCLQGVAVAHITHNGQVYIIATTHFTWAPNGDIPTQAQQSDLRALLDILAQYGPHVLCGDFNIPREYNFLYEKLTSLYIDKIPKMYTTSLDKEFHRLRHNQEKKDLLDRYMVDYVFTQDPYTAQDVQLRFGLSDHAGVIATIQQSPILPSFVDDLH